MVGVTYVMNPVFLIAVLFLSNTVLSASFCNLIVKVNQTLINEGFHRIIIYDIEIDSESDDKKWIHKDCLVGITQELPNGIYANPDELSDLKRIKKLNAVVKNPINIELPTELSSYNEVYITGVITDRKVNFSLPVHARYHRAVAGGGYAKNYIEPPALFLACPDNRLDVCITKKSKPVFLCNSNSREKCKWNRIQHEMLTEVPMWNVPVGNLDYCTEIALGTFIATLTGAWHLWQTIHDYNINVRKKYW